MAKQTFTTGQVLTAAQMTSLQQTAMGGGSTTAKTTSYVLVAADAGTVVQMNAAGATTITVNTALFAAGDSVQIQNVGAGVCTITAGTATVSTSAVLTLKQYDAGTLYFNSTSAAIFFSSDAADSPLTTKGDLFTYSTTNDRLAVGTNGQTLVADSTASTGLKWATAAAGGIDNFSLLNASGTALSGSSTSVTGISGMNTLYILIANASSASAASFISVQFNTDTTAANYDIYGWYLITTPVGESYIGAGEFPVGRMANNAASAVSGGVLLQGCNSSGKKLGYMSGAGSVGGGANNSIQNYWGQYNTSSTISSVQIKSSTGNFDGGTVYIYGSA